MEEAVRIVDRKFFIEIFESDIVDFAREELEENYDWFDGYPDRSDATVEEIIRERFYEFTDMLADHMGWKLI